MNSSKQIAEIFERYLSLINMPDEPQRLYAPIRNSLAEGGKRMAAPDYFRGHPLEI